MNVLIWTYIQVIVYKRVHSRAFAWRSLRLCCDSIKWHFSTMSHFLRKHFMFWFNCFVHWPLNVPVVFGTTLFTFYFVFFMYTHIYRYTLYILYCIVLYVYCLHNISHMICTESVLCFCVFWLYHEFWWIRVIRLPTFFRTASLTLGQCYDCDCPSVSEVTTANMGTIRSLSTICIFICRCETLETTNCHDANFVVTGGIVGCHKWRQSWHYDILFFSEATQTLNALRNVNIRSIINHRYQSDKNVGQLHI